MTTRMPITLTAAANCPKCNGTGWHVDVGREEVEIPWEQGRVTLVEENGARRFHGIPGIPAMAPRRKTVDFDRSRLCSCLRPDGSGR